LILNKPPEVVSTMVDPEGRRCLRDLLHGVSLRVFPVGRLEYHSMGLVFLTNDGELANQMLKAHYLPQTYNLKLKTLLTFEEVETLSRQTGAHIIRIKGKESPWYEVTLAEARRDELRNRLFQTGHPVEKIKRIKIGNIAMESLTPGAHRPLSDAEVATLRKMIDPKNAAQAVAASTGPIQEKLGEKAANPSPAAFTTERRPFVKKHPYKPKPKPGERPPQPANAAHPFDERQPDVRPDGRPFSAPPQRPMNAGFSSGAPRNQFRPNANARPYSGKPQGGRPNQGRPQFGGGSRPQRPPFGSKPFGKPPFRSSPNPPSYLKGKPVEHGKRDFMGTKAGTPQEGIQNPPPRPFTPRATEGSAKWGPNERVFHKPSAEEIERSTKDEFPPVPSRPNARPTWQKKKFSGGSGAAFDRPRPPFKPRGEGDSTPFREQRPSGEGRPSFSARPDRPSGARPTGPRPSGPRPAGSKPPFRGKNVSEPGAFGRGNKTSRPGSFSRSNKSFGAGKPGGKPGGGKPGTGKFSGKPGAGKPSGGKRPGGPRPKSKPGGYSKSKGPR
jgi:23S rRNA pseudouridine2605 synthase